MSTHELKHRIVPEWADVPTTAALLNLSPSFLNKARLTGEGPPYSKFSSAVRYHLPTVREWAARRMRTSTSDQEAR
jgi:hypothetical protein